MMVDHGQVVRLSQGQLNGKITIGLMPSFQAGVMELIRIKKQSNLDRKSFSK